MTPNEELHAGAESGDPVRVAAALAAGADVNSEEGIGTALIKASSLRATQAGRLACMMLLLAAGADQRCERRWGTITPLHLAARHASDGHTECVAALLAAGASPTAKDSWGALPLHVAAIFGNLEALRLLAAAAPKGSLWSKTNYDATPLDCAIFEQHVSVATYLAAEASLSSDEIDGILVELAQSRDGRPYVSELARQLYPLLVARHVLTSEQWEKIPAPCPCIGAALPEVLRRSEAEAAVLVRHMTADDQQCLRTLALCLSHAQRSGQLPALPIPIQQRLLAEAVALSCTNGRKCTVKETEPLSWPQKVMVHGIVPTTFSILACGFASLVYHSLLALFRSGR